MHADKNADLWLELGFAGEGEGKVVIFPVRPSVAQMFERRTWDSVNDKPNHLVNESSDYSQTRLLSSAF